MIKVYKGHIIYNLKLINFNEIYAFVIVFFSNTYMDQYNVIKILNFIIHKNRAKRIS